MWLVENVVHLVVTKSEEETQGTMWFLGSRFLAPSYCQKMLAELDLPVKLLCLQHHHHLCCRRSISALCPSPPPSPIIAKSALSPWPTLPPFSFDSDSISLFESLYLVSSVWSLSSLSSTVFFTDLTGITITTSWLHFQSDCPHSPPVLLHCEQTITPSAMPPWNVSSGLFPNLDYMTFALIGTSTNH